MPPPGLSNKAPLPRWVTERIDTVARGVLQSPRSGLRPAGTLRAIQRLSYRERINLLVVRGDGARVLRVSFGHRLAMVGVAVGLLVVFGLGVVVGDWWYVRQQMRVSSTAIQQALQQRAFLESLDHRLAELRKEIGSWHEISARVREPFGPDAAAVKRKTGIGGRGITLPGTQAAIPSPLDELNRLSETVREQGEDLRALDRLMGRARRMLAALPSRWPVHGPVNSEFGRRQSPWTGSNELHAGIDIGATPGVLVHAPSSGTVTAAGYQADYGLTVTVDHGADIRTVYGHLSKVQVAVGQRVERGTVIGRTGNTGRSSGPHLHYEILVRGEPVNPRVFLWD